jgi:hypothetical protein
MDGSALRRRFPSPMKYLVLSFRQIKPAAAFIHSYPIGICETQIRHIAYMLFYPAMAKI